MNTTSKYVRHQACNALSGIGLGLVIAMLVNAGAAGAVPTWLAITNVTVFGATAYTQSGGTLRGE